MLTVKLLIHQLLQSSLASNFLVSHIARPRAYVRMYSFTNPGLRQLAACSKQGKTHQSITFSAMSAMAFELQESETSSGYKYRYYSGIFMLYRCRNRTRNVSLTPSSASREPAPAPTRSTRRRRRCRRRVHHLRILQRILQIDVVDHVHVHVIYIKPN